jgi:protease I
MKKLVFLTSLLLLFSFNISQSQSKKEVKKMSPLEKKKIIMVIASKNFRDEELLEPKVVLTQQGALVKVASTITDTVQGMLGAKVKPDMLVKDIKPVDWDAIILVGGSGASQYWNDSSVHSLVKEFQKLGKIVGAICIAPVTLANAGILSGKKATVYESETKKLKDKGANYTGKNVERDGKIITANGPKAAKEFGETIAKALAE